VHLVENRRDPPLCALRPARVSGGQRRRSRLRSRRLLPPTITGDGFCLQRSEDCARDSGDRVITRYHPVLSVPAATIRGMAGDQETVTAAAAGADLVPRASARPPGPVAIAAELLARTRAQGGQHNRVYLVDTCRIR